MVREQVGTRATAGECVNGHAVTDAPENGNAGYHAIYPARDSEGNVLYRMEQGDRGQVQKEKRPAAHRTLCRECLKAEIKERYPDGVDDAGNPLPDPFPNG